MKIEMNFHIAPLVLRNMQEICVVMGVGRATALEWVSMGAPIAVEGEGKAAAYSAEAGELQRWRFERMRAGPGGKAR